MSLRTPSKDGRRPRLLCRGSKERHLLRKCRVRWLLSVCLSVKPVGKPNAGNRHVRFDERDGKRGVGHRPQATAPILDSTTAVIGGENEQGGHTRSSLSKSRKSRWRMSCCLNSHRRHRFDFTATS